MSYCVDCFLIWTSLVFSHDLDLGYTFFFFLAGIPQKCCRVLLIVSYQEAPDVSLSQSG